MNESQSLCAITKEIQLGLVSWNNVDQNRPAPKTKEKILLVVHIPYFAHAMCSVAETSGQTLFDHRHPSVPAQVQGVSPAITQDLEKSQDIRRPKLQCVYF